MSARAREANTLGRFLRQARAQNAPLIHGHPPRIVRAAADAMARHLEIAPGDLRARLPDLTFWQLVMPIALPDDFACVSEVADFVPWTYAAVRAALAELEGHDRVVVVAFHTAGLPLLLAMLAAAWAELAPHRPRHMLISARNLGLLRTSRFRWTEGAGEFFSTSGKRLAHLLSSLRDGSIRRLAIMVDGPHGPPSAGGATAARTLPWPGVQDRSSKTSTPARCPGGPGNPPLARKCARRALAPTVADGARRKRRTDGRRGRYGVVDRGGAS